jgi:TonB family protein
MPPVKENEIAAAGPETVQRPAPASTSSADTGFKQQPVALEVPVTVNGARTVDGGDKREPFSETTKTVLVFGNGAVIRLSSAVAPGQLLFLTNEKTKKEVVCQVVKSKNYRNVSGYVELEFTECVVGFWGMRFPGDRIGSGPQPVASAPVVANSSLASGSPAIPRPAAPGAAVPAVSIPAAVVAQKPAIPVPVEDHVVQKPIAPVSPLSSTLATSFDPTAPLNLPVAAPPPSVVAAEPAVTVSTIPEVAVIPAPAQPAAAESVLFDAPRVSEAQASFLEPAKSATVPLTAGVPNLLSLFEAKPVAPPVVTPVVPPPAPPSVDPETEALKQQTARLQQQLSSMLFSGTPVEPATVSVQIPHVPPVTIQKELAENAAKILEMSHASKPETVPAKPIEPARLDPSPLKLDPPPVKSSLDEEELKIPSWLEPLARNAAAPTSTQELIDREKARRQAEPPKVEDDAVETVPAPALEEMHIPELPMPKFGDSLPTDEERSARQSGSKSSGKGLLFGAIAAGLLLLVGGGWWYMQQPSGSAHSGPAAAQGVQASVTATPASTPTSQSQGTAFPEPNPPAQTDPAALTKTSTPSNSALNTLSNVSAVTPVPAARNSQPSSNPAKGGAGVTTSAPAAAAIEQPKKPALGEVHLAAPKVNANRSSQNGPEPDAGIALTNDDQPGSGAEALNAGLVGGNNQPAAPAAPLPVGGDVKQAKLIASVPPQYPALAKNQHVSGNVTVDALIDATGKVTTMKVVSGPTLLHQAAMDALKQWKYQPASLDGKPVSMHLTVTIQFRLQ